MRFFFSIHLINIVTNTKTVSFSARKDTKMCKIQPQIPVRVGDRRKSGYSDII